MMDRIYSMRAQACSEDDNVEISATDGVHVVFLRPVLHASDVRWLTGVQPQAETAAGDTLTMRYVISRSGATSTDAFHVPVDLEFRTIDGVFKLQRVDVAAELPFELGEERIERMASAACESGIQPFSLALEMTLAPEDMADLPVRDEILSLVGAPSRSNDDATELRYEFTVAGTEDEFGLAVVKLEYDQSGTRLLKMTSSYSRFRINADFQSGIVQTSFTM